MSKAAEEKEITTGAMVLRPSEAMALAQLVKRISFADIRANAVDDDEAYLMLDGLHEVAAVLANAGFSPW